MGAKGQMTINSLLKHIMRYVKPYRWLVFVTLTLTLIGSLLAQVNAIVLDRSVDAINILDQQPTLAWDSAMGLLLLISSVLLGKELLAAVVNFGRRYYGERMRILVGRDLIPECSACPYPDVYSQCVCGTGGTVHRAHLFLRHLCAGRAHESRTPCHL